MQWISRLPIKRNKDFDDSLEVWTNKQNIMGWGQAFVLSNIALWKEWYAEWTISFNSMCLEMIYDYDLVFDDYDYDFMCNYYIKKYTMHGNVYTTASITSFFA